MLSPWGAEHEVVCVDCGTRFVATAVNAERCKACARKMKVTRSRLANEAKPREDRLDPVVARNIEREKMLVHHINRMAGQAFCPVCHERISATRDCRCPVKPVRLKR